MKKMRAIICTKYGQPEVLQIKEIEQPAFKDNEVLIKIFAASVSVADTRVRGFRVPVSFWIPARIALGITKPKIAVLGMEIAGEIVSAGKNVKRFKVGDQVFAATGHSRFGGYAEYINLPEASAVVIKPACLTFEEAAAVPLGGLTALYFLRQGKIQSGQKVLIYGASGSVGTFAVQIAKHLGANVTGVCSSGNAELVKSIGADQLIDYTKEDFSKNGETYDVIFDTVGKSSFSDCIKVLNKDGTYLHAVATPALKIRMKWASMLTGKKIIGGTAVINTEELMFLNELVEKGKIKPVMDRIYPMEQIIEAHRHVDNGHKKGNVVITMT
jgi:2-desacetyl-2-hydroxyethyl bacteriochlorophyllide A dehydrogenase